MKSKPSIQIRIKLLSEDKKMEKKYPINLYILMKVCFILKPYMGQANHNWKIRLNKQLLLKRNQFTYPFYLPSIQKSMNLKK